MRAIKLVIALVLSLTALTSACSRSCTDDYNPANPTSCSYNPVYAGLVHERGANVGENFVRTDSGTSGIYLIVDPPNIEQGSPVTMSVLNTSEVDVEVGPSYRLDWFGGRNKSFLRECSLDHGVTAPGGEESEVLEMMPCAGKDGDALPLGHYNFELEVAAGGGEVPGGLGSRFRLVR